MSNKFFERMKELTLFHKEHCPEYGKMLNGLGTDIQAVDKLEEIPFLPARLFKAMDLKSIPEEKVFKIMYSSGTTGHPSKIYLDRENALAQQIALSHVVESYIGKGRRPMLIIDSEDVLKDRKKFSARGAGILGFSIFATKTRYALDKEMNLNKNAISEFLKIVGDKDFLVFGFTSVIWQYLVQVLEKEGIKLPFEKGSLIHGGGWKKLADQAVDEKEFARRIEKNTGIRKIMNYYGMVEQTGSIYLTCEEGHYHISPYSEIIIRRPEDLSVADIGETGLIQVMSTLPTAYPGHSILTEDLGIIDLEKDCPCGRQGRTFRIIGRVKGSEIRGCSDAYGG